MWDITDYCGIFKDKKVLDLACHQGRSTKIIAESGAKLVVGVGVRPSHIDVANSQNSFTNVSYFCQDITNYGFISPLVLSSEIVSCFGVFYHLFDHFRFFQNIMTSNIEFVLLETLYGPETTNPDMFWSYETTDSETHGWLDGYNITPYGTPNLSWIKQSAQILNFDIDSVSRYYFSKDFSNILDHERNKRMIVRLFNRKKFPDRPALLLDDIWEWDNSNLVNSSINF